jgi:molecular chaperone GrpE (heat shock protein)
MYLTGTSKTKKGTQRRPPATPPAAESTSAGSDPDDTSSSGSSEQEEQKARQYKIPKRKYPRTKAEIEQYRKDLKHLAEHSDEFFCSHSLPELIKLDDKLGGGGRRHNTN